MTDREKVDLWLLGIACIALVALVVAVVGATIGGHHEPLIGLVIGSALFGPISFWIWRDRD